MNAALVSKTDFFQKHKAIFPTPNFWKVVYMVGNRKERALRMFENPLWEESFAVLANALLKISGDTSSK